ncbi:MAG: N-6 DNA methylase [Candidatus Lokiarchaeota archaeon]|nr:N-6 DNA methylase [Candidatus Lokiarchaeota archaeon]
MSYEIEDIAKSILKEIGEPVIDEIVVERNVNRVTTESIRIAALIQSFSKFTGINSVKILESSRCPFLSLSYPAEQNDISLAQVKSLVRDLVQQEDDFGFPISTMTTTGYIDLMHQIHSIGVFNPLMSHHVKKRRQTGAIYTPFVMAHYITKKALTPVLKEHNRHQDVEKLLSFKMVDPAAGPGVFLIALLSEMVSHIESVTNNAELETDYDMVAIRKRIAENIYGVDLDRAALDIADISISLLSDEDFLGPPKFLGVTLKQGNSLISLKGMSGKEDHQQFFSNPEIRLPFEWRIEFPEVFQTEHPGFDCVVMNPPYNRLKPNLAEFLRERLVEGDREIRMSSFDEHKERLSEDVSYFRKSGEYQLANSYTIDTYRLFIERAIQLANSEGRLGFIVPSTLLGDLSARNLREYLLKESAIEGVEVYTEQAYLFDGVTQSVCIVTTKLGLESDDIDFRFGGTGLGAFSPNKSLTLQKSELEQVSGSSIVFPQVTRRGLDILQKLHRHSTLSSMDWLVIYRGELDLTQNSSFIQDDRKHALLIRGANIRRFRIEKSSIQQSVPLEKFIEHLSSSRRQPHIMQNRIACQQISNRSQRWRLKFTRIAPNTILANSCNYIAISNSHSDIYLDYLLGVLNSSLLNWRFSLTNTNNHVSNRELASLPIVDPDIAKYEQKQVIQNIINIVQNLSLNDYNTIPLDIEVFRLFGFDASEAREVLFQQKAEAFEISEICSALDYNS